MDRVAATALCEDSDSVSSTHIQVAHNQPPTTPIQGTQCHLAPASTRHAHSPHTDNVPPCLASHYQDSPVYPSLACILDFWATGTLFLRAPGCALSPAVSTLYVLLILTIITPLFDQRMTCSVSLSYLTVVGTGTGAVCTGGSASVA